MSDTMKHFWIALFIGLVATAAQGKDAADPRKAIAAVDDDVRRAMQEEHVPGVAVGMIADGKVIMAKGYGIREVGKPALVDADTIFDIGSMTKSFTATAVAAMVDDGKLKWDEPAIHYLPWFRMYDPIATQLVTPRDMLSHRSGLTRHDFIRVSTYLTREELVRRIRYFEPAYPFREGFHYSNLMYTVAGYLAGEVNGTTWEDLVKQRIFVPLGMTHSNTSAVELQQSDNFAHPHDFEDGKIIAIPVYDYQKFGVGPNGAVNTCVSDMLKYLQFHLADGKLGDRQVISVAQMQELHKPVVPMPRDEIPLPHNEDRYYAMGWEISYRNGHKVLEHNGGVPGFTSDMVLIPDRKIGFVVMNNQGSNLPPEIAARLTDRLVGRDPVDYIAKARAAQADGKWRGAAAARKAKFEAARIPNTKPTLDLSAYAGTYFHPAFGNTRVERDGERLIVRFDAENLTLEHYNYDTFAQGRDLVQFHLDGSGKVAEMLLPLETEVKPFVFVKQ
jgi:CubicO group peptidase (beta-lactamase class C family)